MRILIPTDFSVLSEYAYVLIQRMMMAKDYEVTFLHVLQVPETVSLDADRNFVTCGEVDAEFLNAQKKVIEKKLSGILDQYQGNIQVDWVVGKLTDAICKYAETGNYKLIAMGTSGAFGVSQWLSGSNTQMVSRKTKIPVLSLMCDRADWELNNVLFVQDFSEPFLQDLHWLEHMVDSENSTMHFLHVESSNHDMGIVQKNMQDYANKMGWNSTQFHTISDTHIEDGVIHFNQMNDMDLVVLSNSGRKNLFGHTDAEKLINHMFKPIITFH